MSDTEGPLATTTAYIDTTGTLIGAAAGQPVNPESTTQLPEVQFEVTTTGTYPITAETLGADIANIYLSFINNGQSEVPGQDELMKLAVDTSNASLALLGGDPTALAQVCTTVGALLGGEVADGLNISKIMLADMAGTPPSGVSALDSFITQSTFGSPDARGSIMRYLGDIHGGMTSANAYADVMSGPLGNHTT